jgi:two-component system phosphate regulon response regulator PhoB
MGDGSKRTSSGLHARKPVLLVADDEPEFLLMLLEFLGDQGFDVLPAKNARAALGIARAVRPDAMLLDLTLPDKDGIEVAREMRAGSRTRHIPIILLTGRIVAQSEVAGLDLEGVLTKPIGSDVLLERLHAVLERSARVTLPDYAQVK